MPVIPLTIITPHPLRLQVQKRSHTQAKPDKQSNHPVQYHTRLCNRRRLQRQHRNEKRQPDGSPPWHTTRSVRITQQDPAHHGKPEHAKPINRITKIRARRDQCANQRTGKQSRWNQPSPQPSIMRQTSPTRSTRLEAPFLKWLSFDSDSNPDPVLTIHLSQSITNLAHRAERGNRAQNVIDQILLFPSRPSQSRKRRLDLRRVARRLKLLQLPNLSLLNGRIDSLDSLLLSLPALLEPVNPDNHRLPLVYLLLKRVSALLNLTMHKARLDSLLSPAQLFDPGQQLHRTILNTTRQRFQIIAAGKRVSRLRHPRLVSNNLLRPQRNPHRILSRQRQRLITRIRMQRLRTTQHRRQSLNRHPRHIIVRLLRRQRFTTRLGMKTQLARVGITGLETVPHQPRPDPTRRSELCNLL